MVPFDDRDGPARPESLERGQALDRARQVLQDETHEHMVEGLRANSKARGLLAGCTFVTPAPSALALACATETAEMSIERDACARAVAASGTGWAPMPHPISRTELPAGYEVSEWRRILRSFRLILEARASIRS